jgi:hypothetical protein
MWLHRHQLNNLLKESGGDVESCSINTLPHADSNPPVRCINCRDTFMRKINFLEYSDIVFDHCPSCGAFWLDGDELAEMHGYMHKIEEGSHSVKNVSAYGLLVELSRIAYSIFH